MSSRPLSIVASSPPVSQRSIGVFMGLVLVSSCLVLLMFATGGALLILAGLMGAAGIAWATWRWPIGAAVALAAIAPINRFLLLLIFNVVSSPLALTALRLWDDALVSVLLIRVVHDAFNRRKAPHLMYLDVLMLFFIGLTALYIFYPGTLAGNSVFNRFNGFRFDAFFLLAYFVGRGLELKRRHIRWLLLALIPSAVAVAAVAVWQAAAPGQSAAFFQMIHFDEFTRFLGGNSNASLLRTRDLAGAELTRVTSLVTGDLPLAYYQVFMIPFAAALYFAAKKPAQQAAGGLFLVAMLGVVVLTVTRSAVLASVVALLVITLLGSGIGKMMAISGLVAALGLAFLLFTGLTPASLGGLASPEEGSFQVHVRTIQISIDLAEEAPLGRGLSTAGPLAQRTDLQGGFTNESWYLQLATEIGITGAVLFSVILLGTVGAAFISYGKVKDPWLRALTLGVAGSGLGFILVGFVLHVWEFTTLSELFWLMAGIAICAPRLEAQWEAAEGGQA
jgi:hypothetical protein